MLHASSARFSTTNLTTLLCCIILAWLAAPAALAQSTGSSARLDTAFVERGDDGVLTARWETMPTEVPVAVYAGTDPAHVPIAGKPAAQSSTASVRLPTHSDSTTRYYFRLVPSGNGEGRIVAERHLPLQGASNFRDLGGYPAADGKRTRWGTIFRSGNIAGLTEQDLALFSKLGIHMVCDLRTPPERERYPDRYPAGSDVETVFLDISGSTESNLAANVRELFQKIAAGEATLSEVMGASYREMVISAAPLYAQMFDRMAKPDNRPFLFHCQGGQDRAGIGAALTLSALGVTRDIIVQDYLLTNRYRAELSEQEIRHYAEQMDISVEAMHKAADMEITADAILTIFDEMQKQAGSVEAYLREALDLSSEQRVRLQDALLAE